jgi:hypothetical protein
VIALPALVLSVGAFILGVCEQQRLAAAGMALPSCCFSLGYDMALCCWQGQRVLLQVSAPCAAQAAGRQDIGPAASCCTTRC